MKTLVQHLDLYMVIIKCEFSFSEKIFFFVLLNDNELRLLICCGSKLGRLDPTT